MKKVILIALVALLLAPFSAFAGGGGDRNDGRPRVGILLPPIPNDFHAAIRDNVLAATARHPDINWEITWAVSAAQQPEAAQHMMDQNFDLMIIMPSDGALMSVIAQAIYDRGTPTVIVNRPLNPGTRHSALVTGDNFGGGQNAARVLGERLGGTGNLAILRFGAGNPIDSERLGGFMDVFPREFPGVNIIGQAEGGVNRTGGLTAMETLLIAHPHIDAIFALDDEAALGAITAIQAAGRTDVRYITGFGGAREAYELLLAGGSPFVGSMSFFPTMIADGVEMAVRILRGDTTFPRETRLTSQVVDASNAAQFMPFAY